jgi:hypothetical protein
MISFRGTMVDDVSMAALLKHADLIDCECSQLTSTTMRNALDKLMRASSNESFSQVVLKTETLIIRRNHRFFLADVETIQALASSHGQSYHEIVSLRDAMNTYKHTSDMNGDGDDTASEDEESPLARSSMHSPWFDFCLGTIGTRQSSLRRIDCSYIIQSEEEGYVLCYGLLRAMHQRKLLNLPTMELIVIQDLMNYSDLARKFLTEMNLHFPNVSVICELYM